MTSFTELHLFASLQNTLDEQKKTIPTEIQSKALPLLFAKKSLVGVAETGSGKTLTYVLPILHTLKTRENNGDPVKNQSQPRALVLVPTRDLGEQVAKVFKPFTHTTRLRVRSVLGGMAFDIARRNVNGAFEVLVATPGRLGQLLDRQLIDLSHVDTVVFDEADQMLDAGFLADAKKIVESCAPQPQMVLLTATLPAVIEQLMAALFVGAEVLRTQGSHRTVSSLQTKNMKVENGKRLPVLEKILARPTEGGTLIFTNTRDQCDQLASLLTKKGFTNLIYRGEMDPVQRRKNLKKFREGEIELLISTDLASRGLDVEHVGRVINYHLPKEMQNYLHRVGRTARIGRTGVVFNLVTERDGGLMTELGSVQTSR